MVSISLPVPNVVTVKSLSTFTRESQVGATADSSPTFPDVSLNLGGAVKNSLGEITHYVGAFVDITARKAAEARILDRNEQLNAIYELSPDGFVSFDTCGRVRFASPAFLRMTGYVDKEIIGLDEAAFSELLSRSCRPEAPFVGIEAL
ncbi:MAG TPA: PAS domain-containing protein, partial [Rhodoferax sp.]